MKPESQRSWKRSTVALTARVNGKWATDGLSPYWFNRDIVARFFADHKAGANPSWPEILIELYLSGADDSIQILRGVHNSHADDAPGLAIRVAPSPDYAVELAEYLKAPDYPQVIPVEYYDVLWQDFSGAILRRRPKELGVAVIDSRTIRSTSGVDYHTREMLGDFVTPKERAQLSVAHRTARHAINSSTLASVNKRIADLGTKIHDSSVGLQMDQSSNASWEAGIVPQVADIPFALVGQGQQASIKVGLAMNRGVDRTAFVLVEEPENHLSHTSLMKLIARIESLAGQRQMFLTTHSSYVLNRLGLDKLHLLYRGASSEFAELDSETIRYFQRLSGYDTLRLVLAAKVVLVEGPSDEIVFHRAYRDATGKDPVDDGIDVISMKGVALARSLELCAVLGRKAAVLRDNDGQPPGHWQGKVASFLSPGERELFIGHPNAGHTLEPQLISANDDAAIRYVLGYDGKLATLEYIHHGCHRVYQMNRVTLSVAGSRKTQSIVDACSAGNPNGRRLVLTYTRTGQAVLEDRLRTACAAGTVPEVMGWYSFLLHHMIRPYLPLHFPGQRLNGLNFDGNPGRYAKGPRRFLDSTGRAFRIHLSRLAVDVANASKGLAIDRLSRIYSEIHIDEVQDLTGCDLRILEMLMKSTTDLFMVGDVRQSVYDTNPHDPNLKQYRGVKMLDWFTKHQELGPSRGCTCF